MTKVKKCVYVDLDVYNKLCKIKKQYKLNSMNIVVKNLICWTESYERTLKKGGK